MPILRLLCAFLALSAAAPGAAYWEYTHRLVASIAFDQVQPATRARIRALLRESHRLETPECPTATLEDASYWADCIKPMGDRFSYQSSWHYQNVDICKPFDLKAACKDGNCVSAQVERQARLLADKNVPVRERLMALAFLVHFMGDLAQPMHAGDRGDKGGNDVKANYGLVGGRTNLHSIWDGYLAERAISTPPGGAAGLVAGMSADERDALAAGTVTDWSRESWAAARDQAYASLIGDPCGEKPTARPTLTEAEVQKLIPMLRRDVTAGGLRLARLLDDALGPEAKAPGQKR